MKITKIGHCCLLIEEKGLRVLTDPGTYTTAQDDLLNIDVVLITHEHTDHFHLDSVKKILERNTPKIVTNGAVKMLLEKEGIGEVIVVEDGETCDINGVKFAGYGREHAVIHKEWPVVQNTGYFIGERLYYPGDAFYNPARTVEVLALPVAGPWMKISEAIDFATKVAPKSVFPVHDGGLNEKGSGFSKRVGSTILEKHGIRFIALEVGRETEI